MTLQHYKMCPFKHINYGQFCNKIVKMLLIMRSKPLLYPLFLLFFVSLPENDFIFLYEQPL